MLIKYVIIFILTLNDCFGFNLLDIIKDVKIPDMKLIYPGTKWCGAGNVSKNKDDLGSNRPTDVCCREHDMCDDVIEVDQSRHGLNNTTPFTSLNCRCDLKFYHCLKNCKLKSAEIIGNIYFDILGLKCYRKYYPILECIDHDNIYPNRCTKYRFDETLPKTWEWFDVPKF